MSWLWHWLRRPWLAILAGLIGVMLSLAVWRLPQLPGQLVEENAASATWLLNTSANYGIWGSPFLALGLFDVLHSPLPYLLLALLLPTLAAQLADQIGALSLFRGLLSYPLAKPPLPAGEVLNISTLRPLYRWRGVVYANKETLDGVLGEFIHRDFSNVREVEVPLALETLQLNEDDPATAYQSERRVIGFRFPRLQYLRPLLMLGLLVSVIGAWIALAYGWQITTPPLAPGGSFRSATRELMLHYTIVPTSTAESTLDITLQNESLSIPITELVGKSLGPATIEVRPSYPALWISTEDGSERLTLPGETKLRSQMGMVFANPGSEESVLIPDLGVGLRIVQRSGSDGFVLEVYRSDAIQPIYRAEITDGGQISIPFGLGDTNLFVATMPGVQVNIRHLPGLWLVPVGIFLALIGALAFLRTSSFVIAQAAPWAGQHTVVVVQSDHPNIVHDLRVKLESLSQLPVHSADGGIRGEEVPPAAPHTGS